MNPICTDVKKIINPTYVNKIPTIICLILLLGSFKKIKLITKNNATTSPKAIVTSFVTLSKVLRVSLNIFSAIS